MSANELDSRQIHSASRAWSAEPRSPSSESGAIVDRQKLSAIKRSSQAKGPANNAVVDHGFFVHDSSMQMRSKHVRASAHAWYMMYGECAVNPSYFYLLRIHVIG